MIKLIPYDGEPIAVRSLLAMHRGKVRSLVRIISRNMLSKTATLCNSLITPEESKYAKFMANEDVELTVDEVNKAIKHHFNYNDHRIEHFADGINGMNLIQLNLYVTELMVRAGHNANDKETFMTNLNELVEKDYIPFALRQIIRNTAEYFYTRESLTMEAITKKYEQKEESNGDRESISN